MRAPTHPALRKIYDLESSPDYPRNLYRLLHESEYEQCAARLGTNDQIWLVEYLDGALGRLETSHPASRKCLRDLKTCSRTYKILPSSHENVSERLTINLYPTASGGFSDIFEGKLDGSRVCVKRLRPLADERLPKITEKSYGHAAIWKHLNHPNILPLLSIATTDAGPVQFVSRWIAGGDLQEYLLGHPDANRLNLLVDVAEGLKYLHSREVIHGDLKGPNILVDTVNNLPCACLADFDVTAVTKNSDSRRPYTQQKSCSVPWSPPEVLEGGEPSKEGDVYSFAMVMIEVFIKGTPFGDESIYVTAEYVRKKERHSRPGDPICTEDLWLLIEECWRHEPHLRLKIPAVSKHLASAIPGIRVQS